MRHHLGHRTSSRLGNTFKRERQRQGIPSYHHVKQQYEQTYPNANDVAHAYIRDPIFKLMLGEEQTPHLTYMFGMQVLGYPDETIRAAHQQIIESGQPMLRLDLLYNISPVYASLLNEHE